MRNLRRSLGSVLAGVLGAVAVAAAQRPAPAAPLPSDEAAVVHVLNRLTFGPRPGEVDRVRQSGLAAWIDGQLDPSRLDDSLVQGRLLADPPRPASVADQKAARQYGRAQVEVLASNKILRAVYSERQLEEVLVDFWFNHFNVFAGKGRTSTFVAEYERAAIRPHVLGSFRTLLGATAKSPAMLFYLDNWLSADPDAAQRVAALQQQRRARRADAAPAPAASADTPQAQALPPQRPGRQRGLNENYARELLELHTLGVDGGYTQQDIVNVARAFTGWTIAQPRNGSASMDMIAGPGAGAFRFTPALHDPTAKSVLGETIKAGGGMADGEHVLDILAAHPSTARHIATRLAQRFVSDEPPASLVSRAAARFRETGGNLREVVRVIVTSPEFFAVDARRSKVKTPLEFVTSAVRSAGRDVANPRPLLRALQQMGMPLYMCQPPTGYDITSESWVSAGALVSRMNMAQQIAGGERAAVVGGPEFQRK